jgi:hypothetical protein
MGCDVLCSTHVACKERQSFSSPVDVVDEDRDAIDGSFLCDDRFHNNIGRLFRYRLSLLIAFLQLQMTFDTAITQNQSF